MFRKIVTELAFSPTLAGNIGYYVRSLRNEVSRRQVGLIFTLLATTVQLITVVAPPESANSKNPEAFVDNGIQSLEQYLEYYDQNTANIRDLLSSLGITRSEIEAMNKATLSLGPSATFWSIENPRTEENAVYSFRTSSGDESVAYYQPLSSELLGLQAYTGSSSRLGGQFSIIRDSASLVTQELPLSECESWQASPSSTLRVGSWTKDGNCLSEVNLSLNARKISSSSPEADQLHALDRIAYTLSIKNTSDKTITLAPSIDLEDILEYSRILDYGGGEYDFDTKKLDWKATNLAAEKSLDRTFIVQLLPTIPATAVGQHITASYDCRMSASFGNSIESYVDCPITKRIEQLTTNLPTLPPSTNVISGISLLAVVAFMYARARQQLSEIYIIRHNHLGDL